jgi:hypothetical protein
MPTSGFWLDVLQLIWESAAGFNSDGNIWRVSSLVMRTSDVLGQRSINAGSSNTITGTAYRKINFIITAAAFNPVTETYARRRASCQTTWSVETKIKPLDTATSLAD